MHDFKQYFSYVQYFLILIEMKNQTTTKLPTHF